MTLMEPQTLIWATTIGYTWGIWLVFANDWVIIPKGQQLIAYYEPSYPKRHKIEVRQRRINFIPWVIVGTRNHELIPLEPTAFAYEATFPLVVKVSIVGNEGQSTFELVPASVHIQLSSYGVLIWAKRWKREWKRMLVVNIQPEGHISVQSKSLYLSGTGAKRLANRIGIYLVDPDHWKRWEDEIGFDKQLDALDKKDRETRSRLIDSLYEDYKMVLDKWTSPYVQVEVTLDLPPTA